MSTKDKDKGENKSKDKDKSKKKGGIKRKGTQLGNKIELTFKEIGNAAQGATGTIAKNVKKTNDVDRMVEEIFPSAWIESARKLIITLYASIGFVSFAAFLLYSLDFFAAKYYDGYTGYDYVFMYTVNAFTTVGSVCALIVVYKFGDLEKQLADLEHSNEDLRVAVDKIDEKTVKLQTQINDFQETVHDIAQNGSKIGEHLDSFEKLEAELGNLSSNKNDEIVQYMSDIKLMAKEFKNVHRQLEKANLLELFFEIEFRDDKEKGLNEQEYQIFMTRLDQKMADNFGFKFEDLDTNGDGRIDVTEFQNYLNDFYDRMDRHPERSNKPRLKKRKSAVEWAIWAGQ